MKRRHVTEDGRTLGNHHENPLLNSIIYDVEFQDGRVREYGANIIAEAMYSTIDPNGHRSCKLDCIFNHQSDKRAATDNYVTAKSGQRRLRKTTVGWKLLVCWTDET